MSAQVVALVPQDERRRIRDAAVAKQQQALRDSVTAEDCVVVMNRAEAHVDETRPYALESLSPLDLHNLRMAAQVGVRYARPEWRRLARQHARQAIAEELTRLLSHRLCPEEIRVAAHACQAMAMMHTIGILAGTYDVTPREYADAVDAVAREGC